MLERTAHLVIFGAFLVICGLIGFFLWNNLFPEKITNRADNPSNAQPEYQHAYEKLDRASPLPGSRDATDEAIADYTKWLAIFTAFLVLATIGLFVSGERSIEVARQSANAAIKAADAAKQS